MRAMVYRGPYIGALDATVQAALADTEADAVILAGDSAGGNLCVVQAMRCRDRSGPQPSALVLFSPAVDMTMSNPTSTKLEGKDPILTRRSVRATGEWWAGERPITDPMISPLYGDLHDLPPMTVVQGGYEIILPDVEKFVAKARDAGNDIVYHLEPKGFHVNVATVGSPESRHAFDLAARRIMAVVDSPPRP